MAPLDNIHEMNKARLKRIIVTCFTALVFFIKYRFRAIANIEDPDVMMSMFYFSCLFYVTLKEFYILQLHILCWFQYHSVFKTVFNKTQAHNENKYILQNLKSCIFLKCGNCGTLFAF